MNLPKAAVALNSIVTRESLFRARESEYVSFLARSYWLFTDKRFARSKERSCRLDYIANFYERLYRTTDETTAIEKGKIRKGEGDRVRERERGEEERERDTFRFPIAEAKYKHMHNAVP